MPRNINTNWKSLTDEQLLEQNLFMGAYGWSDCDAVGRVWARSKERFETAIARAMKDELERAVNEDAEPAPTIDDLWYVGPFVTPVSRIAECLDEPARVTEMLDDMRTDWAGWVY